MADKEPSTFEISTAQRVMKICLIVSMAVGCLTIILAWVGDRGFLKVSAGIIPFVALQWFFYLLVKAKQRPQPETK
jgi:hypothetical protein